MCVQQALTALLGKCVHSYCPVILALLAVLWFGDTFWKNEITAEVSACSLRCIWIESLTNCMLATFLQLVLCCPSRLFLFPSADFEHDNVHCNEYWKLSSAENLVSAGSVLLTCSWISTFLLRTLVSFYYSFAQLLVTFSNCVGKNEENLFLLCKLIRCVRIWEDLYIF